MSIQYKVLSREDTGELTNAINTFVENKEVISIQFSSSASIAKKDYTTTTIRLFSVLIEYKEKPKEQLKQF